MTTPSSRFQGEFSLEPQVTATEILSEGLEIGVKDGKIVCLGFSLPVSEGTRVLDAQGAYITPGGVDSHVHLQQPDLPAGDTWESGTRGAIAGGTTTVICFAGQKKTDESLFPIIQDYHSKAKGFSYCDYGFHMIVTNPTPSIVQNEFKALVEQEGITSVKLYMTYDRLKIGDRGILDIMMSARALGITTMIHAENSDMIALITERLEERGLTDPYYHAISRPSIAESEATYRAISLAELIDVPILLVHVSSQSAVNHIRDAQTRMLPIHGETCPQYLYLLSENLKSSDFEGAKYVCSPPLRHETSDLDALWEAIANGTFTTLSSDHAPADYHGPIGKRSGIIDGKPVFAMIPNGLPGIETRIPLLFEGAVGDKAKITLPRFVQVTSWNPAKLYGLSGVKGNIAPGYDADLVIWYPPGHDFSTDGSKTDKVEISVSKLHHDTDYTPYEGMTVANWPRYTVVRGEVVWDRDGGGIVGKRDFGQFLKRKPGGVVQGRFPSNVPPRGMYRGERDLWA